MKRCDLPGILYQSDREYNPGRRPGLYSLSDWYKIPGRSIQAARVGRALEAESIRWRFGPAPSMNDGFVRARASERSVRLKHTGSCPVLGPRAFV